MPKAHQGPIQRSSSSTDPLTTPNHPNVLKRNQVRCFVVNMSLLLVNASDCIGLPSVPEKKAIAETTITPTDGPKSKYERLENRISELEALLRQKENRELSIPSTTPPIINQPSPSTAPMNSTSQSQQPQPSPYSSGELTPTLSLPIPSPQAPFPSSFPSSEAHVSASSISAASNSIPLDIIWPNWPPNLPGPELLRHLIDVFFTFHPHANRLFHVPTFMNSITYGPNHPKFPCTAILHAICAIGSLYTGAVTSPPLPDFDKISPDEIFLEKYRVKEQRPDSFAEQQAKLAREMVDRLNVLGQELFEVFQANIILTWFYWSHGRWVDVFLNSGNCVRLSIPLGLNMCPPFHSISKAERPPSIVPPARTVIEDETRRNAFWLAYALERHCGMNNGWAMCLDDQDISQLLPVQGDQFESGTLVYPWQRQWAHTGNLLLTHPEGQIDSFILYIKATILISRVKAFNTRFRARLHAGDSSVTNSESEDHDPRGSPAFIELDHITSSFRSSFPSHLRNPIMDNVVDNHLYTACLVPYVAAIVLHDPHADVRRSGCISALKILTAARAILDMIYSIWSTSFDITLLDTFCSFAWFTAGRVLVRFLQAAIDAAGQDQIATLRAEVEFVHSAVLKLGQRIPIAYRFSKMLQEHLTKTCGETFSSADQSSFTRQTDINAAGSLVPFNQANYPTNQGNTLRAVYGSVEIGMVPQENTIFGNVIETYDGLRSRKCGFVKGEVTLQIQHCLLTKRGVQLHEIDTVLSHEQALGQCQDFLDTHLPNASRVKTSSTAAAAQAILTTPGNCAAICSKVFRHTDNYTRFYVVVRDRETQLPVGPHRAKSQALIRLWISPPPQPPSGTRPQKGVIQYLASSGLSVSRIDRRPSDDSLPFRDVYFVEVASPTEIIEEPDLSQGSPAIRSWTAEVENAIELMRKMGGEVDNIGLW
ncbi:hypothetical protein NP233_g4533 [Leucocoprinus birnbaumii]|uniref:Prephenate dehydratase domain-containing protein n=1 Tax=Leucocoprinus birnbaumii TaxID=56174 RepID=A0AAD5YX66_9AGAR|nr:hypothetical protein NP233_g4533 [Leucocoprinus birnbaumii]